MIELRKAYEAPNEDTLMAKYLSIEDAYNLLKESDAYGTIGGYVLKAGDTKAIGTYDDLMATLRLDYINNPFEKTPSKNFVEILYKANKAGEMTIPIGVDDPWPCTSKGFLANVNGEIVPEYKSPYLEPSGGEMYLVDGITGERTLIAVYNTDVKRFIPISGSYWTENLVKILKGE